MPMSYGAATTTTASCSVLVGCHNTLVQAFITSRLDYCKALFYGITDELIRSLQSVQTAADRLHGYGH